MPPSYADPDDFYARHVALVWRTLARFGVREAEREDLVQDVFEFLCLEHPSSDRAFVYGTSRRFASNHRRLARHREFPSSEDIDSMIAARAGDDPASGAETKQALLELSAQLERLPAVQYEAFILFEIEEFTLREVAEAMESNVQTTHSRIVAARDALAKWKRGRVA